MPDRLPYKLQQPLVKVSILGYTPDLDPSTRGALVSTAALASTEQGYLCNTSQFQSTGVVATTNGAAISNGTCTGAFYSPITYKNTTANQTAGVVLAGFQGGGIYLLQNSTFTDWCNNNPGFGGGAPQPLGGAVRFTQFGNDILLTSRGAVGGPAVWNTQGATNFFTALGGSPPSGSIIQSVSNNFVFICGVNTPFDDWNCSAAGTDNSWTPNITTLAANGRLEDTTGAITALKPLWQLLSFACYKQSATYLGQFVGPPTIWQFIPISTSIGTFSQESVVDIGGVHVFPSLYDFYAFDGSNLQKIDTPLHDWFYRNCNIVACNTPASPGAPTTASLSNILGTFDQASNTVFWFFPTTTISPDTWIAWNIKSNKWTRGTLPTGQSAFTGVVSPYLGPFGVYGSSTGALQSSAYQCGVFTQNQPLVNVVNFGYNPFPIASTMWGFGSLNVGNYTADTTASMTTGDIGDGLHWFMVTRVRPKFEKYPGNFQNVTCTGFTRNNLGDASQTQVTGPVALDSYGWFNIRQSAKWHAFQISLGDACILSELEVEMVPQGIR